MRCVRTFVMYTAIAEFREGYRSIHIHICKRSTHAQQYPLYISCVPSTGLRYSFIALCPHGYVIFPRISTHVQVFRFCYVLQRAMHIRAVQFHFHLNGAAKILA
jgi:hypothetical protein